MVGDWPVVGVVLYHSSIFGLQHPHFNDVILSGAAPPRRRGVLTRAERLTNAVSKDLPRNEQGHSIDQSLLSVGEMVRRAPGWARRVLTMTGFLEGGWDTAFRTVSIP